MSSKKIMRRKKKREEQLKKLRQTIIVGCPHQERGVVVECKGEKKKEKGGPFVIKAGSRVRKGGGGGRENTSLQKDVFDGLRTPHPVEKKRGQCPMKQECEKISSQEKAKRSSPMDRKIPSQKRKGKTCHRRVTEAKNLEKKKGGSCRRGSDSQQQHGRFCNISKEKRKNGVDRQSS